MARVRQCETFLKMCLKNTQKIIIILTIEISTRIMVQREITFVVSRIFLPEISK